MHNFFYNEVVWSLVTAELSPRRKPHKVFMLYFWIELKKNV